MFKYLLTHGIQLVLHSVGNMEVGNNIAWWCYQWVYNNIVFFISLWSFRSI